MGQKTNPIGFRIKENKNWSSKWYASKQNYANLVLIDHHIRRLFRENVKAYISNIEILRSHDKTTINIYCDKPGIIIGKKGSGIERLRNKICSQLNLKNITFNIIEENNIEANPAIIAQNIATRLSRRGAHRKIMKHTISSVMRAGALGVKIKCAGRLGGAEIARPEVMHKGSMPLSTLKKNILYAACPAQTIYGVIGVKVWVYKGGDNVTFSKKD